MSSDLPLDSMSVPEKLQVLEQVWASLCSDPSDVSSPDWHAKVLEARSRRLSSGEATVSSWIEAKQRLLKLGQ